LKKVKKEALAEDAEDAEIAEEGAKFAILPL